jgi:hypothetical protein
MSWTTEDTWTLIFYITFVVLLLILCCIIWYPSYNDPYYDPWYYGDPHHHNHHGDPKYFDEYQYYHPHCHHGKPHSKGEKKIKGKTTDLAYMELAEHRYSDLEVIAPNYAGYGAIDV